MQRKLFTLFVLFFLSVNLIYSQDDSEDWFWNKTITEIDFEGLDNVKKSELIGITSSFIDKPFTEEIYSELLDRLYSLEFFEDVIPYAKHHPKNPDDILLVFQVEELPIIKSVNFSGNSKVRNGELREKVKIKASDIFSENCSRYREAAQTANGRDIAMATAIILKYMDIQRTISLMVLPPNTLWIATCFVLPVA